MMQRSWIVRCDAEPAEFSWNCLDQDQATGTKRQAKQAFADSGWLFLRKGKTICPRCAQKEKGKP